MLSNDFYHIASANSAENTIRAEISLNAEHHIFKGHFPSVPVVPGVCMLQIMKELLENNLNKELQLIGAKEIKFLSLINPLEVGNLNIGLDYTIAEGQINAVGSITDSEKTYFKFKGQYQ